MALNLLPKLLTASTSIDVNDRVFIVEPLANMTITLPVINCDGIRFLFERIDNDSLITVNVTRTAPNNIVLTSTSTVTTYAMNTRSIFEIISNGTDWYTSELTSNITSGSGSYISGTCTANNSNPYVVATCVGPAALQITQISWISNLVPSIFTALIYNISAAPPAGGSFIFRNVNGTDVMIISVTTLPAVGSYGIYSTTVLLSTPVNGNKHEFRWLGSGGGNNDKVGICSIRLA